HNVLKTSSGDLFAVTTFDYYQYDFSTNCWKNESDKIRTDERLTDIASHNDTLIILSRSHGYISQRPYEHFDKITLANVEGGKKEISLFKTLWTFHSGELFGLFGKLLVDFLGIITIILCITGLLLFFTPQLIRRRRKTKKSTFTLVKLFKSSLLWHNKPGSTLFYLLLILCLSGMFLRPPLLISIIKAKHKPLSFTTQDKTNPWHDKLRCIRYDEFNKEWLIYTSDGLLAYKNIKGIPSKIKHIPPISVMGLQVFEPKDTTTWIIGSFSGLFHWDRQTGESRDYFTGKIPEPPKMGPPVISNPISGFSSDFDKDIVFNYFEGAKSKSSIPQMPKQAQQANMSLWHVCLEAHTGRIYTFLPEIIIALFIPISGILFLIILISGYILYRRRYKRPKKNIS
ncbi:MAG: PepSY domain-containing protein, partial [Bacteroidales bacterium]|nr:PepSY domain-containing protein [Bacteroidales bacterium]